MHLHGRVGGKRRRMQFMKTKILDGMQEMQANEPERKDTRGDRNSQCTDFIRDGLLCQTTSTTLIAVQHLDSRVNDRCSTLLTLHRIVGILSVFVKNKYASVASHKTFMSFIQAAFVEEHF